MTPTAVCKSRLTAGLVLAFMAGGCAHGTGGPSNIDLATAKVAQQLPAGWAVANREDGQVPQGHYWGDWGRDYNGPRGRHVALLGPSPVAISWRTSDGTWRQEPIARESLELWIMPATYHEGLWSRINPHAPSHPPIVFSGASVIVFAMPSHHVVDEVRSRQILASATETGWPGSPSASGELSWRNWRTRLEGALAGGTELGR